MSDQTTPEAGHGALGDDELFDDVLPLVEEPASSDGLDALEERQAAQPVRSGIDALAEADVPAAKASASRDWTDTPDARARIRSSRLGTLGVLLVTAVLVIGGMWLVNRSKAASASTPGAATAVTIPGRSTVPAPAVGKAAQDFTATGIDGKTVSLGGLKGHPVWLTFGASWCASCQAEVPDIEATYKKFASRGVVVLAVNITEDTTAVKAYAQRVGLTYPMVADPNSVIADEYRVNAIPSHFFIDSNGTIQKIHEGSMSPDDMSATLTELMTK